MLPASYEFSEPILCHYHELLPLERHDFKGLIPSGSCMYSTTKFNINHFSLLATQCTYVFCEDFPINRN